MLNLTKLTLPETSPSPWPVTRSGVKAMGWGISFGVSLRVVFYLLDHHELPTGVRIALVGAPFVPALFCVACLARWLHGLDELQQRMQLQSMAAIFPGLLLVIIANELLRVAGFVPGVALSFRSVGYAMLAVYGVVFLRLWWRSR